MRIDDDGKVSTPKSMHPFAAIEHRVIDSPAYADLPHSACRLLTLMTRQLTINRDWPRGNNGHLHAVFGWCHTRGIGSEHTLQRDLAALISHLDSVRRLRPAAGRSRGFGFRSSAASREVLFLQERSRGLVRRGPDGWLKHSARQTS
jgi:hypothetical protein